MSIATIARGIGLGFAALLLNVAAAFLMVWLYSLLIAPGQPPAFYQAAAERWAPVSGIVIGAPLLFGAGLLAARWARSARAALVPALAYIVIDALLLSLVAGELPIWTIILSYLTKLAAAAAAYWLTSRRPVG